MKALKIAKFQWFDTLTALGVYYAVFLLAMIILTSVSLNSNVSFTLSGVEISSIIFVFIVGLNSFKDSFKFSQANNISRKTFFKGVVIGMIPITICMSIIDLIINRIYNISVQCPTIFDMIYGSFGDTAVQNAGGKAAAWVQANDIPTLLGTMIWQFALYSSFYLLGVLISLIYYRSNKLLKTLVSVTPVILIMLLPASFWNTLVNFMHAAFGLQSRNPYMAVSSFIILASLFAGFAYLLIRKAVAKE